MCQIKVRSGFTLIEMMVSVAIIGVLIGMLIPAVQMARAQARRNTCLNNLRQLGLATHNFESAQGYIPPAARLGEGTGWQAYLLPHIERSDLYERLELTDPDQGFDWASDGEVVLETIVPIFKCPTDPAPPFIESRFSGFVSGLVERGVSSYLACASGTVPSAASDLRSSRLELKITETGDAAKEKLVREMRSGAMAPTQTFIDHSSLTSPYPEFKTRVELSDILDGTSNTILIGEGIFDTSRRFNSGGSSRTLGMDHWYIGSGDMDISSSSSATTNPVDDLSEFMATTAVRFNFYHYKRASLTYAKLADTVFKDQLSFSFNSWHTGDGLNFSFADGSARWIRAGMDPDIRSYLGRIADRQKIEF